MATYNQVSYGSKGSDVTELQKLLNENGYSLTVDGQYGPNTKAAIEDYQSKNNLTVDGIAGNETWGSLKSKVTAPEESAPVEEVDTSFKYDAYQPSDAVNQAQQMINQQLSQKPGSYQSTWQDQLNDTINQILNREKFSYDLNGDALYQQYKDQYVNQGKMAMMDTMGQAQAMTGGYGNSYAQNAGQQAYHGYLQQLNNKIPELYQLALSTYQTEGNDLYDRASLMAQQEDLAYGRYRDQVGDWQAERDYLANRYDTERDYDYGMWADNRDFAYGQYADDRANQQWQAEFDEAKRQYDEQMALKANKSSGGGGSSYRGSPDDDEPADYGVAAEYIALKKSGTPATALDKMLKDAIAEGLITMDEASELRQMRY